MIKDNKINIVQQIDKILPQTQCQKCGYDDCLSYAQAIADGDNYNKCLSGGNKTLKELAIFLNKKIVTIDTTLGNPIPRQHAIIDENLCIGCKKCILSCPVNAIVGSKNLLHSVIENECSGCELCITPCPMDCISLSVNPIQPQDLNDTEYLELQKHFRERYQKTLTHRKSLEIKKKQAQQKLEQIDKKAYIIQSLNKFKSKKKSLKKDL